MKDLIPVAAGVLDKLIERRCVENIKFDKELALAHVMTDWVQGRQRSRQQYADIWGWSKTSVVREMPGIYDEAERLLSFRLAAFIEDNAAPPGNMPELFPGMPKTRPKHSTKSPIIEKDPDKLHNKKVFHKESWEYKYAQAFVERLNKEGIVSQAYRERPLVAMQNYSYVFDLLHRIDKHPLKTIRKVVLYLFTIDDWWIRTKNIQSPDKLRRRKNKDGEYVFDRLLREMNDRNNAKSRKHQFSSGLAKSAAESLEIIRSRQENQHASAAGVHAESGGGRGPSGDTGG